MVYCGKPSKSCRECRNRDIKCDKRKDSCGQCKRARLVCPGYPNPLDVVWRDETRKVVGKNKKAPVLTITKSTGSGEAFSQEKVIIKPVPPKELRSSENGAPQDFMIPLLPPLLPSITSSLEDRAKKFFIQTQLLNPNPHLPDFSILASLRMAEPTLLHLLFVIQAISLMYFSKHHHSAAIMQTAQQNYVAALKHIQDHILDTEASRQDSTLVSVLLLGVFEKLACQEKIYCRKGDEDLGGVQQAAHLDGALALVKLRGESQFDSLTGRHFFRLLSSAVVLSCLEREVTVPAQFVAVRELAARSADTSAVQWLLEDILLRFISLRSSSKKRGVWDSKIDIILSGLDNECLELYHLHTLDAQGPPLTLGDISNSIINQIETTSTLQRLLIQLSIIRLVLAEITSASSGPSNTRDDMISLCRKIYTFATSPASFTGPQMFYFPLYVAARSKFCPSDLKTQIKDLLRSRKCDDASQVVQLLENKESAVADREKLEVGSNPWKEFAEQGLGELSVILRR